MDALVQWGLGKAGQLLAMLVSSLGLLSGQLFEHIIVKSIFTLFQSVAVSLYIVFVLVLILKLLIKVIDNDTVNLMDVGIRVTVGALFIGFVFLIAPLIYQLIYDFTLSILVTLSKVDFNQLKKGEHLVISIGKGIINFFTFNTIPGIKDDGNALFNLIIAIMIVYNFAKALFQIAERWYQYFVILIMSIFYVPGYLLGNNESLTSWFKQLMSVLITHSFQIILLGLGSVFLVSEKGLPSMFLSVGAFISAGKVDKYIAHWGIQAGGNISGLTRSAFGLANNLRMLFRK